MPRVFITGAARRLGRSLARGFAARGWDVAIHYFRSEAEAQELAQELRRQGIAVLTVRADLRQRDQIWNALETVFQQWGSCEVLVNNAGVFPSRHTLSELRPELWDEVLQVNLTACLYTAQAFAALHSGSGRIINIASLGGLRTWRHRTAYNVAKAALLQLTRNLALELAPRISVNAVCPGVLQLEEEEIPPVAAERIPAGRYGTAQDVFEAVYFFATATPYITGQWLVVDGGYHLVR
jgi:3-oxoacyl-[acyl-carrier protein] reductase/pteridine reductase